MKKKVIRLNEQDIENLVKRIIKEDVTKEDLIQSIKIGYDEYFEDFYRDISNQRFALIVSEPQRLRLADESEDWGAENDVWITWVAQPMLCYYEPGHILEKTRVWLLVPREEPLECVFP